MLVTFLPGWGMGGEGMGAGWGIGEVGMGGGGEWGATGAPILFWAQGLAHGRPGPMISLLFSMFS